jgi:hypothetical protein
MGSVYKHWVLLRVIYPNSSCNYISKFDLIGYENVKENETINCIVWIFIFLCFYIDIFLFIFLDYHHTVCLTTGSLPLPK